MVAVISSKCVHRLVAAVTLTILSAVTPPSGYGQNGDSDSPGAGPIAADLFFFPPKTLSEIVEAARITQKLDRTDDARAFLKQILDSQPGETELQALRREIGIAPILDLRRDPRMLPESEQFLKAFNQASVPAPVPAEEMQRLVQDLGKPGSAGIRAASALIISGDDAIAALLAADVQTPAGRVASQILIDHARDLRRGLLNLLDSSDATTRVRILRLLGASADPTIAIRLLRWQFDPQSDENVSAAARDAIRRLSHSQLEAGTAAEAAEILNVEAESLIRSAGARFSSMNLPASLQQLTEGDPRAAALTNARTMLADALIVDPENVRTGNLAVVTDCAGTLPSLTAAATVAAGLTEEQMLTGLTTALDLPSPAAAIEILRALRTLAPETTNLDAVGTALRQALLSPDARVRHLAADLARRQFPVEVSRVSVSQAVTSARHGSVKPDVVIISPDVPQARSMQAVLEVAGFAAQMAQSGPEGFEIAAAQMNCELILLNAESPRWPLPVTLANLRADVRTQNTPIVVFGDIRFASRTLDLAKIYPGVWFIAEPVGQNSLRSRLISSGDPPVVSVAVSDISSLRTKLGVLNLPPILLTTEDRAELKRLAD